MQVESCVATVESGAPEVLADEQTRQVKTALPRDQVEIHPALLQARRQA
ncbi:hypothetical protein [Glycomyces paridis]|nr:hypothetical protein [Glycomyces paridis]